MPDLYDSGRSANRNMYICLAAGTAALATGAVLYFVVGHSDESPGIAVAPTTSGVTVSGRF